MEYPLMTWSATGPGAQLALMRTVRLAIRVKSDTILS
jgi:hypothetical protein